MRKLKNKNTKLDKKIKQQHLSPTELMLSLAQEEKNQEKRVTFFLSLLFDASLIHLKKHRQAWDCEEAYLKPILKTKLTKCIKKLEQFIEKLNYRKTAYEIMSVEKYKEGLKIITNNYKHTNLIKVFKGNNFNIMVNLEFVIAWLDLLKLQYLNNVGSLSNVFNKDRAEYNKTVAALNKYIKDFTKDIDINFTDKNNRTLDILA